MILWRYRDIAERARGGPIPAWLLYAIGIAAMINFLSFVTIAEFLGGDAVAGHMAAGHYFLGYHGKMTEVSRAVFQYSLWHSLSVVVTAPLAMLAWVLALRKRAT